MRFRSAAAAGIVALLFAPRTGRAAAGADLSWAWKECKAKTFDARELLEGGKYPAQARSGVLAGSAADSAIPFFACLALTPGREGACGVFPTPADLPPDAAPSRRCRELAAYGRSAVAVLKSSGDGLPECRSYLAVIGLKSRPQDGNGPCLSWTRAIKDGNVKAFCQRGAALGLMAPREQAACPELVAALAGDPARCPPKNTAFCAQTAAMLKGLRSWDKADCRAAPLCEALTGRDPQACGPYLKIADAGICDALAQVERLEEAGRKAAEKTPMPPTESDKAAVKAILQKEKEKVDAFRKIRTEMEVDRARAVEAEKLRIAEAARQERERAKALEKHYKPGEPMKRGAVNAPPENPEPRRTP